MIIKVYDVLLELGSDEDAVLYGGEEGSEEGNTLVGTSVGGHYL